MDPRVLLWYHIEVDQGDEVRDACKTRNEREPQKNKTTKRSTENPITIASPSPAFQPFEQADPVKQRGPLALSELHALWEKGAIDRDTFVWCVTHSLALAADDNLPWHFILPSQFIFRPSLTSIPPPPPPPPPPPFSVRGCRADGMDDFHQVHAVPELAAALAAAVTNGRTYPGGSVSFVSRASSWKCKTGDGEVSGPVTTVRGCTQVALSWAMPA